MYKEILNGRNRIDVVVTSSKVSLNSIFDHFKDGCLYFNDEYQRDYCWTEEQQQLLLDSLLYTGIPLPSISVALNNNSDPSMYFEVVDGRQRVTTLILFFTNEIPYRLGDKEIFFSDLSRSTQRTVLMGTITQSELTTRTKIDVSLKQKIEYFHRVNFAGSLQSSDHKHMIEQKLKTLT